MFLRATLADGSQVVSQFTKLARVQRYVMSVFSGQKPFNVWNVVHEVHPTSGEKVQTRSRAFVHGKNILRIEEVEPTTEQHNLDAANFRPVERMQRGSRGIWNAPEDVAVEGVTPGTRYPKHRDSMGREYVIVTASRPGENGQPDEQEVRYYLDGRPAYREAQPLRARYQEETDWGEQEAPDDGGFSGDEDED